MAACALGRAPGTPERDVEGDDLRSCEREELGVHPRSAQTDGPVEPRSSTPSTARRNFSSSNQRWRAGAPCGRSISHSASDLLVEPLCLAPGEVGRPDEEHRDAVLDAEAETAFAPHLGRVPREFAAAGRACQQLEPGMGPPVEPAFGSAGLTAIVSADLARASSARSASSRSLVRRRSGIRRARREIPLPGRTSRRRSRADETASSRSSL